MTKQEPIQKLKCLTCGTTFKHKLATRAPEMADDGAVIKRGDPGPSCPDCAGLYYKWLNFEG